MKRKNYFIILIVLTCLLFINNVYGADASSLIGIEVSGDEGTATNLTVQLLLLVTLITLAPSILLMLTSFTRIVIILHFTRSALSTQQTPPNQVLIGLALFLTFFIMGPTLTEVNKQAMQPYIAGEINTSEMVATAMDPIREFMFKQVETNDVKLFAEFDGQSYDTYEDIPNRVLIPAFILGEITKGFKVGFIIFIPFLVIDMIVASTLMAMGMMMLPPSMISLPFKILFFVMVDGWALTINGIFETFRLGG
ncbi:MAG: flagellar type III secretion system pore protein FliP [Lachnospirales bacterium]